MIKLSLIVTVYNTEPFLHQCFDSLIAQEFTDFEIIVVNDASTDNSRAIIEDYVKKDNRFCLINLDENTPGGVGIPANIGIEKAKGEYIGFIDSDDWADPKFISSVVDQMKSDNDLIVVNFKTFDNRSKSFLNANDDYKWDKYNKVQSEKERKEVLLSFSPVPWRKFYRKAFLLDNKIRFPEGDFFYEDTPFHYFTVLKARQIVLVNSKNYYHRTFREGQTMFGQGKKYLAFVSHFKTISDYLIQENYWDEYSESYYVNLISNCFWIWNKLNKDDKKIFYRFIFDSFDSKETISSNSLNKQDYLFKESFKALNQNKYRKFAKINEIEVNKLLLVYKLYLYLLHNGFAKTISMFINKLFE